MAYGLVLVIHVLMAFFLVGVILIQGGRGGMGESLGGAAAQSLFGGGANTVMTKITAIGAGLFMITSLSLAILSKGETGSVLDRLPAPLTESLPAGTSQVPAALPVPPAPETPPAPATPPSEPAPVAPPTASGPSSEAPPAATSP